MNNSSMRAALPIPVAVLAAVALLAALIVGATSSHDEAHAESHANAHAHADSTHAMSASQARFHDEMRKLWEDHIVWTRAAIVAFADDSDGFAAAARRLLRNQVDIGDAIKPFYGDRAGDRLAGLLHDHITIAVEVLKAAKAGDQAALDSANTRWYANGKDVADAISALDPRVWPRTALRDMMRVHLDQTLAEASAELTDHYRASIRAYDAIHHHILDMADALSSGIIAQFPARFR
ncbi:MAG TPA: hypothetical protein VFV89_08495 [Nocardioides sp.]|uniref:hypothetical protein n=1 Tax=Nocardioides sp. TaxID=35761 RepID=UPI002E368E59|nr:hypothetical protein [Nocardioides sp.]HEX5087833.1 hypothetical protein [Nocardioides sp.]